MIPAFVIDASIAMAWCFIDEHTIELLRIRGRLAVETAVVPSHWLLEVANVLLMAERKGRFTRLESAQFQVQLGKLNIETDRTSFAETVDQVFELGRNHQLTSYDAAYLELALRRGLPIATLDAALRRAATTLGVEVLGK